MLQLTWMDPFLNRSLANFKKDFSKLLYTYKEMQKNLQNKGVEEKEDRGNVGEGDGYRIWRESEC